MERQSRLPKPVRAVFTDPRKTRIHLVLNPDQLSLSESRRIVQTLGELEMPVARIIVNKAFAPAYPMRPLSVVNSPASPSPAFQAAQTQLIGLQRFAALSWTPRANFWIRSDPRRLQIERRPGPSTRSAQNGRLAGSRHVRACRSTPWPIAAPIRSGADTLTTPSFDPPTAATLKGRPIMTASAPRASSLSTSRAAANRRRRPARRHLAFHCRGDFRQHFSRTGRVVQHASAMIGNHNRMGARIHGQAGIVRRS
jgi:hypothetical protein